MSTGFTSQASDSLHTGTGSDAGTAGGAGDADAGLPGAAPRGGAEYGADRPNLGSARSDYGELAYGGLDAQGLGGKSVDDFGEGRRDAGGRGQNLLRGRLGSGRARGRGVVGGGGGSSAGMLLVGVGLGAALMYLLDPERGRRRRALLRDKLVSASNKTADVASKTARDLRNRTQGLIAETGSALGVTGRGRESGDAVQQGGQALSGEAGAGAGQ